MTQAWNIYSFAVPIVQQFFGVEPMASQKTVTIKPQMPDEWDEASLENVKIADNSISVYYMNKEGKQTLKVTQINPEWELNLVFPNKIDGRTWEVIENTDHFDVENEKIIMKTKNSEAKIIVKQLNN
jgi:hypothetical protein